MMVVAVWPLVSGQWPGRDMFGETPSTPTSLLPPAGKVAAAAPNISHFTSFPFYIPTVVALCLQGDWVFWMDSCSSFFMLMQRLQS